LPITQADQQAGRAIFAGVFGTDACKGGKLLYDLGQAVTQGQRQEIFSATMPGIQRTNLRPRLQHTLFVAGQGAERLQALAKLLNTHRA
jgi:hypothetical protein